MIASPETEGAEFEVTQMADLHGLADFVERCCASVPASEEAVSDVRLASEEVATNVLQHGYGGRPGLVTVRIDGNARRITVTLTDDAPAFDPSDIQAPDLTADGEHRRLGGLGWHLVEQVMDEVTHEHRTHGGNVFTLVRRLSADPPGSGNR